MSASDDIFTLYTLYSKSGDSELNLCGHKNSEALFWHNIKITFIDLKTYIIIIICKKNIYYLIILPSNYFIFF
jgi:hypothetical protein